MINEWLGGETFLKRQNVFSSGLDLFATHDCIISPSRHLCWLVDGQTSRGGQGEMVRMMPRSTRVSKFMTICAESTKPWNLKTSVISKVKPGRIKARGAGATVDIRLVHIFLFSMITMLRSLQRETRLSTLISLKSTWMPSRDETFRYPRNLDFHVSGLDKIVLEVIQDRFLMCCVSPTTFCKIDQMVQL